MIYLITGASSGIGWEMAQLACRRGHTVYGVARRKELLDQLAEMHPGLFVPVPCDVTDQEAVRAVCRDLPQLPEVVILNAGMGDPDSRDRFDVGLHQRMFAVNYFGVLYWIEELLPRFAERGRGTFVATSSLAGYRGLPTGIAYSASKGALSNAMESLRLTYRDNGVRFVNVHPGFIRTPMSKYQTNPQPFLLTADQAARKILDGINRRKLNINFPWPLWFLIMVARLLPPRLYQRIVKA